MMFLHNTEHLFENFIEFITIWSKIDPDKKQPNVKFMLCVPFLFLKLVTLVIYESLYSNICKPFMGSSKLFFISLLKIKICYFQGLHQSSLLKFWHFKIESQPVFSE